MFSLGIQFGVMVDIDTTKGVVKFTGEKMNVVMTVSKIKDMNLLYMCVQQRPQNSLRHVRWQYEGSDGDFKNFPREQAKVTEKAFCDGCHEVYIETSKNIRFKIVFKEWKEYCVTGRQGRPKGIRRLDVSQGETVSLFTLYQSALIMVGKLQMCFHCVAFLLF